MESSQVLPEFRADCRRKESSRPERASILITCHHGFTMNDLASNNETYDRADGEAHQDGTHANFSWNCGVEGPIDDVSSACSKLGQTPTMCENGSGRTFDNFGLTGHDTTRDQEVLSLQCHISSLGLACRRQPDQRI
jgi:pullulanase/glycogen debranching enzyme